MSANYIDTVDIVDKAIAVVVNARRAGKFLGIDPHIGRQVRMGVIDAGVDDGNDDIGVAARGQSLSLQVGPGLGHIGCHQVPLLVVQGICAGAGQ